ncbi:MAG: hypothetical protein R3F62_20540 [Planctomycetota bacterium]
MHDADALPCSACGAHVHARRTRCPHCGAPLGASGGASWTPQARPGPRGAGGGSPLVPIVLGLAALGVLALVAAALRPRPRRVPPGPPPALAGSILRPVFHTRSEGPIEAGTAFVVRVPGLERNVLLTALHLLGPDGGMSRAVPAAEVSAEVEAVSLTDAFTGYGAFEAEEAILIPSASLASNSTPGDVLAFWVARGEGSPLTLAPEAARVGQRVWLSAKLVDGSDTQLHPARVVELAPGTFYYEYLGRGPELQATSGAPVLDGAGEVVGINLGGGVYEGKPFGMGNPIDNWRPALERALAR